MICLGGYNAVQEGETFGTLGYWLASAGTKIQTVWSIDGSTGTIYDRSYPTRSYGIRPVVALPASTVATKNGELWTVVD